MNGIIGINPHMLPLPPGVTIENEPISKAYQKTLEDQVLFYALEIGSFSHPTKNAGKWLVLHGGIEAIWKFISQVSTSIYQPISTFWKQKNLRILPVLGGLSTWQCTSKMRPLIFVSDSNRQRLRENEEKPLSGGLRGLTKTV